MTRFDDPALECLPPDVGRRIDAACERFEDAWQSGSRPRIDDFPTEPDGPGRAVQLRELVLLDVRYRRKGGEFPRRPTTPLCSRTGRRRGSPALSSTGRAGSASSAKWGTAGWG